MDRIILKLKEIIYYILHPSLINSGVILRGKPKILFFKNIKFEKNVRINEEVFIHAASCVKIGENTTLSYRSSIITESYDLSSEELYKKRHHQSKPINIGKNVWIGANAMILPGVSISDNIVVGAGSVVTKDLNKEYRLYAGNPAKYIKSYGNREE